MEAEMQLKQLKRLAQELGQCERKLSSNVSRLDALCEGRCSGQIQKKLQKQLHGQSSFLKGQAGLCKDMTAVLEHAVYLYEQAEEAVIQAAETDTRRYAETLRTVSLKGMTQLAVSLEAAE